MMTEVMMSGDGSCRGNPGPGGYCAILQANGREKILVGGDDQTTNNRMELTAVLAGLRALKRPLRHAQGRLCVVTVVSDSQYVVTTLNGGKAKANRDLVQQVRAAVAGHRVTAVRVAGHSGHAENERCHQLAHAEATRRLLGAGGGVRQEVQEAAHV